MLLCASYDYRPVPLSQSLPFAALPPFISSCGAPASALPADEALSASQKSSPNYLRI